MRSSSAIVGEKSSWTRCTVASGGKPPRKVDAEPPAAAVVRGGAEAELRFVFGMFVVGGMGVGEKLDAARTEDG
jgi:hypothetical protein